MIEAEPGTYILILKAETAGEIPIGRRGALGLRPGYYLYVGSALGPGGLKSRLARHIRTGKRPHWHIDYLREQAALHEVWYRPARERLEHVWAHALDGMPGLEAVPRFGCSDCRCRSHLFRAATAPRASRFCDAAGQWQ